MKFLSSSVVALSMVSANLATGQTPPDAPQANQLYHQWQTEYKKASELERKGKIEKALASYEESARLGDASWSTAEQASIPTQDQPSYVCYNAAITHLDAARLLVKLQGNQQRIGEHCQRCIVDLGRASEIEQHIAARTGNSINPSVWKIDNAAAYAFFLQGDLSRAREEYQQVLTRNPTYQPAKDAIAQINKREQQQNGRLTPQGDTQQKEENRRQIMKLIESLKIGKDVFDLLKLL